MFMEAGMTYPPVELWSVKPFFVCICNEIGH